MSPGDTLIALFGTGMLFGIPLSLIWTAHHRKMLEIRLKMQGNTQDEGLRREVAAMREELRALRDTTMQYDLSFDTALQRMEQRVQGLERQTRTTADVNETQNITVGGR